MTTYFTVSIISKSLPIRKNNYCFMRCMPWVLVVCSALLYAGSFLWCGWFAALYLVPLLFIQRYSSLRLIHACVWLITAYAVVLFPCALDVCFMSQGNWWQTVAPPLFLYAYLVNVSIIYFACTLWGVQKIVHVSKYFLPVQWSVAWSMYWLFVDRYIFSFFLRTEGFPFFSPLVPLAAYNLPLAIVAWGGTALGYAVLGGSSLAIFLCATSRWRHGIMGLFLVVCLCGVAWYRRPESDMPDWVGRVCHVPYNFCSYRCDHCVARCANEWICRSLLPSNQYDLYVMPESALDGVCSDHVHQGPVHHDAWHSGSLLAGVHVPTEGRWCNSALLASRTTCRIVHTKHRTMPLIEELPAWADWQWARCAYLYRSSGIISSTNQRETVDVPGIGPSVLYICSDLFLQVDAPSCPGTVIALVNDSWIRHSFLDRSLVLLARLKAVTWGRRVLYCSYRCGCVVLPSGQWVSLPQCAT